MGRKQDFRMIREVAEQHGYEFAHFNSQNHPVWVKTGAPKIVTCRTLGDPRVLDNIKRDFKRGPRSGMTG